MPGKTIDWMTNQIPITNADDCIALAMTGERAAFDQIMILHQRKVVSIALRMLGNREDAMDAAQESFLRAYRYLNKYDQSQDFSAWLYRIVVNVCHDIARKRNRTGFTYFETDTENESKDKYEPVSHHNTESDAIFAQEQQIIAQALASLPDKERAAIVLRDVEGFSTEDTAKILGCSSSTIRSQICSARKKLRDYRKQYSNGKLEKKKS